MPREKEKMGPGDVPRERERQGPVDEPQNKLIPSGSTFLPHVEEKFREQPLFPTDRRPTEVYQNLEVKQNPAITKVYKHGSMPRRSVSVPI